MKFVKRNIWVIAALIFFLAINTLYFWEVKLGFYAMPMTLILFIIYCVLVIVLFRQVYIAIKEKLKNKKRLISIGIVSIILFLIYFRPYGLIDFEKFEGGDLLVAGREGVANCRTVLKLKLNNKFVEKSICFGVSDVRGNYLIKGDSIFFSNVQLGRGEKSYYQFAVINQSNELRRFKDDNDSLPDFLYIAKNELKK